MHQTLPSASRPATKPERRATRATQLQKTLPLNALLRRLYLQPFCFEDFASTKRQPPSVTSVYSRLCSPALEKFTRRVRAREAYLSVPIHVWATTKITWGQPPFAVRRPGSRGTRLGARTKEAPQTKALVGCISISVRTSLCMRMFLKEHSFTRHLCSCRNLSHLR